MRWGCFGMIALFAGAAWLTHRQLHALGLPHAWVLASLLALGVPRTMQHEADHASGRQHSGTPVPDLADHCAAAYALSLIHI